MNKSQKSFDQTAYNLKKISYFITQPLIEVFYDLKNGTLPLVSILIVGCFFDVLLLTKFDAKIFQYFNIYFLYPKTSILYFFYIMSTVGSGFWIWGFLQAIKRKTILNKLTEAFTESELKSPMGKIPNLIFDKPVDELVRRLRVSNAFLPKAKFIEAKDRLESTLQVFIDDIYENKAKGTIDILYSHYEMSKLVELNDLQSQAPHSFLVGQTRAKTITSSLLQTPHLLIGGQTGGGKSTFLRQVITTLYCNNKNYNFTLIDMKGGLEFQLFDNRDRIKVISKSSEACDIFSRFDEILNQRFELLKANQCKDITEFNKLPVENLKLPNKKLAIHSKLNFEIVVIDEAAELFLSGGKINMTQVQDLTRKAIRLAAQGRAVGIHLIVATQKPDSKAISSQIKANLTGIISFPMATLGASFSILGNGRAKALPAISGRAIWKSGLDQFEVQTPYLSTEQTTAELDKVSPIKNIDDET